MRNFQRDKKGISNIIVVALSLVVILAITTDVILWNYEMNQLDWEKMREEIELINAETVDQIATYNSQEYAPLQGTNFVSGNISNLISDDENYMNFQSYYSGTNIDYFVDNNNSNIDSIVDKGLHSNFTAQQYGPDVEFDVLTEEKTGYSNSTLLDDSFEDFIWDSNWNAIISNWREDNYPVHTGSSSAWATNYYEGTFTCDSLDASGATAIYVDFWLRKTGTETYDFTLYYYDGSSYDLIEELDDNGIDNTWIHFTAKITDNQYFVSNFRIRFDASLDWGEEVWIDDVIIKKEASNNYVLDLEVQWTNVDFDEVNEQLCIYMSSTSEENLKVDLWTGSAWQNLIPNLNNGWNNSTIKSYLTSSTFTIRFKGETETNDSHQDTWQIDASVIHVWTDQYTSEVEFFGTSNSYNWTWLNWTIDSSWNDESIQVTIQVYDFISDDYPKSGDGFFTYSSSIIPNIDENKYDLIQDNPTNFRNETGYWKMKIKGIKETDSAFIFKIDQLQFNVETIGSQFTIKNRGSYTLNLVSLWINNSTDHQRYDINLFINSGDTINYVRYDINLPNYPFLAKIVTERGNVEIFSEP